MFYHLDSYPPWTAHQLSLSVPFSLQQPLPRVTPNLISSHYTKLLPTSAPPPSAPPSPPLLLRPPKYPSRSRYLALNDYFSIVTIMNTSSGRMVRGARLPAGRMHLTSLTTINYISILGCFSLARGLRIPGELRTFARFSSHTDSGINSTWGQLFLSGFAMLLVLVYSPLYWRAYCPDWCPRRKSISWVQRHAVCTVSQPYSNWEIRDVFKVINRMTWKLVILLYAHLILKQFQYELISCETNRIPFMSYAI